MSIQVEPPSVFLPSIKHIKASPNERISSVITRLRNIYLPEVRGSTRRRHVHPTYPADSPTAFDDEKLRLKSRRDDLENIRADSFERSFAIQWLTRFISLFSEVSADFQEGSVGVNPSTLEEAASLLAICAGAAASGAVTRTFTFPLPSHVSRLQVNRARCNFDILQDSNLLTHSDSTVFRPQLDMKAVPVLHDDTNEISVVVRDAPLESADFSSVGAQTWGGSCVLAEMLVGSSESFGIFPRENQGSGSQQCSSTPFRALELGAGTGLASLVLGKILGHLRSPFQDSEDPHSLTSSGQGGDTVIATDFHPSVLANLRLNFAANFPSHAADSRAQLVSERTPMPTTIPPAARTSVLPLDWASVHASANSYSDQLRMLDPDIASQSQAATKIRSHCDAAPSRTRLRCDNTDLQHQVAHPTTSPILPLLESPFDLIIGADIIYEHLHARWVRSCVERFLKKPLPRRAQADMITLGPTAATPVSSFVADQPHTTPLFHLVIPLRQTHAVESRSVEEVFLQASDLISSRAKLGSAGTSSQLCHAYEYVQTYADDAFLGHTVLELAIVSQEDIVCDAYSDRGESEEVVYRYYKIGWV